MSVPGPSLHSRATWATRETKCLSIILKALEQLRELPDLPKSEVDLNRHFYFCLLEASRELYPEDEIAPVAECNNQPDPDDEARAKREMKRPDFQWIYLDRYEADPRHSSKQFVVECKRLGRAVRSNWILNLNYANHGVDRFRSPEWSYAKRVSSGVMVGYWQDMDAHDILNEINGEIQKSAMPHIILLGGWKSASVSRGNHAFDRAFEMSPFNLHHLWIDLRAK